MANLTDVFISPPTGLLSKLTGCNISISLRIIAVHVARINHGANRVERTFIITWLCSKRFFNLNANDMPLLPVLWMITVVLSFQLNSMSLSLDAINDCRCGVISSYHRTYHVEKSKFKDEDGTSMAENT